MWLTDTDPDLAVYLEDHTLVRMDHNLDFGKSKARGVYAFIKKKYCCPFHITKKHQVCTKDIEFLELSLRPYYLPWEIHQYLIHSWTCNTSWGRGSRCNNHSEGLQFMQFGWTPSHVPVCHPSHPEWSPSWSLLRKHPERLLCQGTAWSGELGPQHGQAGACLGAPTTAREG